MSGWRERLRGDPLSWLLETDPDQPAVRFHTLRDLQGVEPDDKEVSRARDAIMRSGPVPVYYTPEAMSKSWNATGESKGTVASVYRNDLLPQTG